MKVPGLGKERHVVAAKVEDKRGKLEIRSGAQKVKSRQHSQVASCGLFCCQLVLSMISVAIDKSLTSPPKNRNSVPNLACTLSTSHSPASKQSSGPLG